MAHISYSSLKDWVFCAFYHKLTRIDKIDGFTGNEFTAFGTTIHSACEKILLNEDIDESYFIQEFSKNIESLSDVEIREDLVNDMRTQGNQIIPEIKDALDDYFGEYEVVAIEQELSEPIDKYEDYQFNGYIDAIVKTPDGKYHIFDWKTCSWGWDAQKRSDAITTYQLTLYKYFYSVKMNIDPKNIETHFALLKRTAKKDRVEFFRVTSGPRKTQNALKLLEKALYNIKSQRYIKNRLSCKKCVFRHSEQCP